MAEHRLAGRPACAGRLGAAERRRTGGAYRETYRESYRETSAPPPQRLGFSEAQAGGEGAWQARLHIAETVARVFVIYHAALARIGRHVVPPDPGCALLNSPAVDAQLPQVLLHHVSAIVTLAGGAAVERVCACVVDAHGATIQKQSIKSRSADRPYKAVQ